MELEQDHYFESQVANHAKKARRTEPKPEAASAKELVGSTLVTGTEWPVRDDVMLAFFAKFRSASDAYKLLEKLAVPPDVLAASVPDSIDGPCLRLLFHMCFCIKCGCCFTAQAPPVEYGTIV